MSIACPKCRHVRQPHEQAPDWQCPACGIAYAKASTAQESSSASKSSRPSSVATSPSIAWGKWLLIAALVFGVWQGVQMGRRNGGMAGIAESLSGEASVEELAQLAATVKPDEVLIYTTTDCPYCAQAKAWMTQYGFAYTECDAQVRADCAQQLAGFGMGVPYLIVRGHHMKEGFDSDEFIAALR